MREDVGKVFAIAAVSTAALDAPTDGDVVFVLSTGRRPPAEIGPLRLARIGALAADCLARAIARGVYEARAWPGGAAPCWRDLPA